MSSTDERHEEEARPPEHAEWDDVTRRRLAALGSEGEGDERRSQDLYEGVRSALVQRGLVSPAGGSRWGGRARSLALAAAAAALFAVGLAAGRASAPAPATADHPTYLLLLSGATANGTDLSARVAEYGAWASRLRSEGALVAAGRIEGSLSDGAPDASLAGVNGYFLLRAADDRTAAEFARTCPHIAHGGRVTALRVR